MVASIDEVAEEEMEIDDDGEGAGGARAELRADEPGDEPPPPRPREVRPSSTRPGAEAVRQELVPRAKATVLMVICKDVGNLSATEVRAETDESGVEMVFRLLSSHESVEVKTDGEAQHREIARRVHARRDKATTPVQTGVGGHQENGAVERANGMVQAQLASVFPGRARTNESGNHSRYAVVSMDVAAVRVDGGAQPDRSKNETDSV